MNMSFILNYKPSEASRSAHHIAPGVYVVNTETHEYTLMEREERE